MKTHDNTILITGGGSGIGEALAHRFAARGDTVIIAGRNREKLEASISGRANMHAIELDIDDADAVAAFPERLLASHPTLNVLINNAGIMRFEELDQPRDLADAEALVMTNLIGPIRMINTLINHLLSQRDAAIINVTSGQAFLPLFATPTYSATKAAMHSYTVSLREKLKGRVEVIELIPPAVRTTITPGQENKSEFVSVDDFADEAMAIFKQSPTPKEILVERVKFQRFAEAEGRFDASAKKLNNIED